MSGSIRARLMLTVMAVLIPAAVAGGWLLVNTFGDRMLRDVDVALEEEAETVADLLARLRDPSVRHVLLDHVAAETDLGPGKRIIVLRGDDVVDEAPPGARATLRDANPSMRVATIHAATADGPLTVMIAVNAADAISARRWLTHALVVGIPCALLVIGLAVWVALGRALRPLAEASRRMEALDVKDLAARVPVENPRDEVGRMVAVLNGMLDRLAGAVAAMRRFTADAAHELRTPLTALRLGMEVTLTRERTSEEYRSALRDALDCTDRLVRVAENLLALARLDRGNAAGSPDARADSAAYVDVAETLQDVAEAWSVPAQRRAVHLEVSAPSGLTVRGAPADLHRLLGNLVDNAVRHSPRGGQVLLEAHADGDRVQFSVADEGHGIPADERERVFERFYRGRGEGEAGSGLGLSIAQGIVQAHGGDITLTERDGGGCAAVVRLPFGTPPAGIEEDPGSGR